MANLFSTTFGIEPLNLIERLKDSERIINDFSSEYPPNYVYIITGLRGSGKTVLMSTIANKLKKDDQWIVVDPGPKNNILENVASEIYETAKLKKYFLKGEFSFSFHGLSFSIDGETPVSTANTLIKRMLEIIKNKGKRVLVTIDEADNGQEMKYFIQAYQSLIREGYPIFLLMTGLYGNISKLQNDKSLTFLYRAPKVMLGPLPIIAISDKYAEMLRVSNDEATELAKLTKGYAYAYQVLGFLLTDSNKKIADNKIISMFDQYLAEYVYDKVYFELSKKEQDIVKTFESDSMVANDTICKKLDMEPKYFGVYRDKLIKEGLLISPTYGYLEFALPRFSIFLNGK